MVNKYPTGDSSSAHMRRAFFTMQEKKKIVPYISGTKKGSTTPILPVNDNKVKKVERK